MKRYFSYLFFAVLVSVALGVKGQVIVGSASERNNPLLLKETMEDLSFSAEFSFLELRSVNTDDGIYFQMFMGEDFSKSQKIGMPELPVYNQLIDVPYGAEVRVEVSNVVVERYSLDRYGNYKLIPAQPSLSKSKTHEPFVIDAKAYAKNEFLGGEIVSVENLGFMSSVRLARLCVSPLRYNPQANSIEFVRSFDAKVRFVGADYEATQRAKRVYGEPVNRPLKMIILSDAMFQEVLQPFIRWKREKGFEIVEVYKGSDGVGTTKESMKAYLKGLWDNATEESVGADYLLICGDVAQIPAFSTVNRPQEPAPTDLYYAEYTGDFLPELFYGRFSAQNVSQMQAIINKVMAYERYEFNDTNYLRKTLLVAGKETNPPAPTVGNGQVNYAKKYLINNPDTDTLVYYNPSSSNYATQIRDSVSKNGYSYINYTAHCDKDGWSNPSFSVFNINNLTNYGKFPLFVNNCCLSNKFDYGECFGEAILRADNKAGIGAIGGSNYTYWSEDYYWAVGYKQASLNVAYDSNSLGAYDRLFHTHNEPYGKWYVSAGQICQAGNLAVEQSGSSLSSYYWEIYHLMGDPSLMPYIGIPKTMSSNIPDSIVLGLQNIQIQTDAYAFVGVSQGGVLIGASQADENGLALINFTSPYNSSSYLKFVITNQFSKPIIDSALVFVPSYPLLSVSDVKYTNSQSIEQSSLNNDEEYFISFTLSNLGSTPIDSVYLVLAGNGDFVVLDSTEYIGSVAGLSSSEVVNKFKLKVVDGVRDRANMEYDFKIYGKNNYFNNPEFSVKASSPNIVVENLSVSLGASNGSLHELDIVFDVKNNGTNGSSAGYVIINSLSDNLSYISDSSFAMSALSPNAKSSYSFKLGYNPADESDVLIGFRLAAIANLYGDAKVYDSIDVYGDIETFETGNLSSFDWVNDASKPWIIDSNSANVYQGNYSLRSGVITDNKKTTLSINSNAILNDSISFYIRVSTETNYDVLRFYIDNVVKLELSGQSVWKRYSFPVSQGEHNFKWEYKKDYSQSGGSDAVWLDNIRFPMTGAVLSNTDIDVNAEGIYLYPNPAKDFVVIANLKSNSTIYLYDALGRLRYTKRNESRINISNLENGIYYILVEREGSVFREKLIIAK